MTRRFFIQSGRGFSNITNHPLSAAFLASVFDNDYIAPGTTPNLPNIYAALLAAPNLNGGRLGVPITNGFAGIRVVGSMGNVPFSVLNASHRIAIGQGMFPNPANPELSGALQLVNSSAGVTFGVNKEISGEDPFFYKEPSGSSILKLDNPTPIGGFTNAVALENQSYVQDSKFYPVEGTVETDRNFDTPSVQRQWTSVETLPPTSFPGAQIGGLCRNAAFVAKPISVATMLTLGNAPWTLQCYASFSTTWNILIDDNTISRFTSNLDDIFIVMDAGSDKVAMAPQVDSLMATILHRVDCGRYFPFVPAPRVVTGVSLRSLQTSDNPAFINSFSGHGIDDFAGAPTGLTAFEAGGLMGALNFLVPDLTNNQA